MEKKTNTLIIAILVIICIIQTTALIYVYNDDEQIEQTVKHITNSYEVTGYSTDFTRISDRLNEFSVSIETDNISKTGIIYYYNDNVATIITSHGNNESYTITFPNGEQYTSEPIQAENNNLIDIFLIETNFEVTPIVKGDSKLLKPGEFVLSRNQNNNIKYQDDTLITNIRNSKIYDEESITAKVTNTFYNTMEGSAVVNQNCEIIGIYTGNNNDTFILNNYIELVVNSIISNSYISNFKLDIKPLDVEDLLTYQKNKLGIDLSINHGIYIMEINEDSLYYDKLRPEDIITKLNNNSINNIYDYHNAIIGLKPNDNLIIECYRNNNKEVIEVIVQ